MIRRIGLLGTVMAGLALACSGGTGKSNPNPGVDSGMNNTPFDAGPPFTISVAGTTSIHPVALALYDAGLLTGPIPTLPGTTVRIDEPLQVILGSSDARQGSGLIDDAGNFYVAGVDPTVVIVGLVATIVAGSDDGGINGCESGGPGLPAYCADFASAATAVYEGNHPTANITDSFAYGDPVAFEEFLNTQLTPLTTLQLVPNNHLIDKGIALGYVVNGGVPVAGAVVDTRGNTSVPQIIYVDDNFNPAGVSDAGMPSSTNKYGIFIVIAPGEPTAYPNAFGILGHMEYGCQKIGSSPGSIFNLIFDPGNPGMCP